MTAYIDLHNHILPGLDDGPRTLNEAVMLARVMVTAGFATVVATPHTHNGKPKPSLILERIAELQYELEKLHIPLKILPGAEQHLEPDIIGLLEADQLLTINRSRYLLLELPFFKQLPPYFNQLFADLAQRGYRPVIPHPERAFAFRKDRALLKKLCRAGAIYQVTWGALVGWLGPESQQLSRDMLADNQAHLFATDTHTAVNRLFSLKQAINYLEREKKHGAAEEYLTTRPLIIIEDKQLDLPEIITKH